MKRNSLHSSAHIVGIVDVKGDNTLSEVTLKFDNFQPEKHFSSYQGLHEFAEKVIVLKITRTFEYASLRAVSRDVEKGHHKASTDAKQGINISEIKNWFVNRYLYSVHDNSLNSEQISNLNFAKSCFSLLNKDYSFSRVDASSNDIMVATPNGEIYYEYLSSGFKSILSIIIGIIKEIEYRFVSPRITAEGFDGIIIIDELELHLHPEWQEKVSVILSKAFPKAQFICTTHSPHIIQFAKPNQIIALQLVDGKIQVREMPLSEFGFQGWTIEEILTDVMGMEDTRTNVFNSYVETFGNAIDNENYSVASGVFEQINSMLHPRSELRKVLKFQLAAIKSEEND